MNEIIGFEYYQPKAKLYRKTTVDNLWRGELFVLQFAGLEVPRLCIKLPINTFIREGDKNRSVNAYDIINEKFYELWDYNEVIKFYGKIRIKGKNVYGRPDYLLAQGDSSVSPKNVYIKLPNEIEKDSGINPAYKTSPSLGYAKNNKYNVLTLYCNACYFNAEYISNESWELLTHKSKTPIKNNGEVEIKIDKVLINGILGAKWVDISGADISEADIPF